MNGNLLSIIVPIFNVENYIEKCIRSILNQSYSNIEVILVDDGSTDKSLFIINKLSEKDNRIFVYSKINQGVSAARNYGLTKAKGKYVTFVDGDDFLKNNVYEYIISLMELKDVECALYSFEYVYGQRKKQIILPWNNGEILDKDRIRKELIPLMIASDNHRNQINGSVCRSVFLRKQLNNIWFDESVHIQEDLLFCLKSYPVMNNMIIINNVSYYYVKHGITTTEEYRDNFLKESIHFENAIVKVLIELGLYEELKYKYFVKRIGMYSVAVSNLYRFNAPKSINNQLKEIIKAFENDRIITNFCKVSLLDCRMKLFYVLMKLKLNKLIACIYKAKEKKRHKLLAS